MGMRERRARGVTLIELMVVILLIGILAGLLLPATQLMRRRAVAARAEGEATNLRNAIMTYHLEYGRWPVGGDGEYEGGVFKDNTEIIRHLRPGHEKNPRKIAFWEHPDPIFRDPWSVPYEVIINVTNRTVTVSASK